MSAPLDDAFARLERARVAGGHIDDVRWFFDNFDRWLRDVVETGQAAPVQRYWGMPLTPARIKRYLRDRSLAQAATEIDAPGAWSGCVKLASEWEIFVSRGGWEACSESNAPPAEITSQLRRALWWASHYSGGATLKPTSLIAIEQVNSAFSSRS